MKGDTFSFGEHSGGTLIIAEREFYTKGPLSLAPDYQIRILDASDLDALHLLEIATGKELQEGYRVYDKPELEAIIDQNLSFGIFHNEMLVAFRLAREAGMLNDRLTAMLELSPEMLGTLGYLAGSYVLPIYRRQKLATILTQKTLERLSEKSYTRVYVTVALDNYSNLGNLLNLGFVIKGINVMSYGPRYILLRQLHEDALASATQMWVETDDYKEQEQLFLKGYAGIALLTKEKKQFFLFAIANCTLEVNSYAFEHNHSIKP